jgi:hypothetical protein
VTTKESTTRADAAAEVGVRRHMGRPLRGERRRMLMIGDGCRGLRGAGRGSDWSRRPPAAKVSVSSGRVATAPGPLAVVVAWAYMRSSPGRQASATRTSTSGHSPDGETRVLVTRPKGRRTRPPSWTGGRAVATGARRGRPGGTLRALDASDEGKGIGSGVIDLWEPSLVSVGDGEIGSPARETVHKHGCGRFLLPASNAPARHGTHERMSARRTRARLLAQSQHRAAWGVVGSGSGHSPDGRR